MRMSQHFLIKYQFKKLKKRGKICASLKQDINKISNVENVEDNII